MRIIEDESIRAFDNLPVILSLLESNKICTSEKLKAIENPYIDLKCFLASIGEAI